MRNKEGDCIASNAIDRGMEQLKCSTNKSVAILDINELRSELGSDQMTRIMSNEVYLHIANGNRYTTGHKGAAWLSYAYGAPVVEWLDRVTEDRVGKLSNCGNFLKFLHFASVLGRYTKTRMSLLSYVYAIARHQHRRTGQHPFGGGGKPSFTRMDSVGGGVVPEINFPGSIFCGGRGGSSRNVSSPGARPIRWGGVGLWQNVSVNCSNRP